MTNMYVTCCRLSGSGLSIKRAATVYLLERLSLRCVRWVHRVCLKQWVSDVSFCVCSCSSKTTSTTTSTAATCSDSARHTFKMAAAVVTRATDHRLDKHRTLSMLRQAPPIQPSITSTTPVMAAATQILWLARNYVSSNVFRHMSSKRVNVVTFRFCKWNFFTHLFAFRLSTFEIHCSLRYHVMLASQNGNLILKYQTCFNLLSYSFSF